MGHLTARAHGGSDTGQRGFNNSLRKGDIQEKKRESQAYVDLDLIKKLNKI